MRVYICLCIHLRLDLAECKISWGKLLGDHLRLSNNSSDHPYIREQVATLDGKELAIGKPPTRKGSARERYTRGCLRLACTLREHSRTFEDKGLVYCPYNFEYVRL